MELTERAGNYAEGKANEAITKAIAQAYADGYRDGYKDREEEIPVDLRDNKTEYVDLGLPSGTLWSNDYEKENGKILYLPYGKAAKYDIPTKEQWKELLEYCRVEFHFQFRVLNSVSYIGPNGNSIRFESIGCKKEDTISCPGVVYFWILDDEDSVMKNAIESYNAVYNVNVRFGKVFCGYKLPLRLVRQK